MRRSWMAVLGAGLLAVQAGAGEAPALSTGKEKASYAIGVETARGIRQGEIEVDPDLLVKGLRDGLSGEKLLMTEPDIQAARNALQKEQIRKTAAQRQKREKERVAVAEENRKEGSAFLAKNGKKEGVVTRPSGLQYEVLEAGEGPRPTLADTVECHYRGTLIDGTVFDSSYDRGKPAAFPVKGVIPGWTEALKLMSVGSKWRLFVPAGLAYGERGAGRQIGPNAALVFEVELLRIM
jgi:FKBP-type peptidyl-prolyl cis-trans isomerase